MTIVIASWIVMLRHQCFRGKLQILLTERERERQRDVHTNRTSHCTTQQPTTRTEQLRYDNSINTKLSMQEDKPGKLVKQDVTSLVTLTLQIPPQVVHTNQEENTKTNINKTQYNKPIQHTNILFSSLELGSL